MPADPSSDFDAAALADLEGALPAGEFRAFIEEYLASSVERLARAEALAAAADLAGLRTEAHTLISTSGSYGIRRASQLARELETACKAGELEAARRVLADLAASSRRAWIEMRARFLT